LFVFDLDWTLIDSRRHIAESANALLESCGASVLVRWTEGGHSLGPEDVDAGAAWVQQLTL
jgi:predicted esterase